ncbi:MAG: hypothetical protein PHC61_13095 [Chitinivibrionales bacterium]|nr:hypothetical protein [Chitinivibrionales bacterium]
MEAANNAILKKYHDSIADDQVYDWMKVNSFRASPEEAKQVMAFQKQEDILKKKIADAGIEISSLPDNARQ